jgi:Tfp pilus assembly protein PilO
MRLQDRDRRALALLAGALLVCALVYFWPQEMPETVGASVSPDQARMRLEQLRAEGSGLAQRLDRLKAARAELSEREKGLIQAPSIAQAQAQLIQIVRRVARSQNPPLEPRILDQGRLRPFGEAYSQIELSLGMECQIDQLVNFLADLAAQPELLALEDLHINAQPNSKQKAINVRLNVTGLAPGALAGKRDRL